MGKVIKNKGLISENIWDYENGFYWYSEKSRLNKILSHYELYKSITNIPGHILEFGVYKGASIIRFATFRDTLENEYSRKIVGFDTFGTFPTNELQNADDIKFIKEFNEAGGDGLNKDELNEILSTKGFRNIDLVKGNVLITLPSYLKDNPETRIALLNLDMDVKEPTDIALDLLYDRVVPGGLILFDDYNTVAGETISVDEFMKSYHLKLEKLPFSNSPSFIRKPI